METSARISYQGAEVNDAIRASIEAHVAKLEKMFGRITACHVNLTGPSQHHRSGGPYLIHIRLALPDGREVNVNRSPPADERHSDTAFAINDAFQRARRQLQDQVRRLQGQTKSRTSGQ